MRSLYQLANFQYRHILLFFKYHSSSKCRKRSFVLSIIIHFFQNIAIKQCKLLFKRKRVKQRLENGSKTNRDVDFVNTSESSSRKLIGVTGPRRYCGRIRISQFHVSICICNFSLLLYLIPWLRLYHGFL